MATTDLHMQVLPADTGARAARGDGRLPYGFAHTATLIHRARAEAPNSLLLDNGDFLCGSGCMFLPRVARASGRHAHPMIEVMNHLGYDAATPGNHDFDRGLAFLEQAVAAAAFPFACANLHIRTPEGARSLLAEYVILRRRMTDRNGRRHELRIGVTGFLPPNSIDQTANGNCHIATSDIIEAARAVVPRIRRAGADLVIALAHSGLGRAEHVPGMENAAIPLAAVEGIDAVISGHRHRLFPGPGWPEAPEVDPRSGTVHGKPVVSPGFWGSHLGVIDLELEHARSRAGWTIRSHKVTTRPVSARDRRGKARILVEPDPRVSEIVRPIHRRITARLARPLGHSRHPLHSFFALASPCRAVQLIQRAQIWHIRRLLEGTCTGTDERRNDPAAPGPGARLPLLSSACSFKTGGYGGPENFTDTPAGPLNMAVIDDLYPFPNRLATLKVSGADIRNWLERAASIYNRALPGMVVNLKAPEVPAYLYETVLGLDYAIDLSRPALFDQYGRRTGDGPGRIRDLSHAGSPVQPGSQYLLITNSYRATGGGGYPLAENTEPLDLPPADMQQVLVEYFRAHPHLETPLEPHWRFSPLPGAVMRFRSAPRARAYLPILEHGEIRPAGQDESGYQLFDLYL